MTVGVLSQGGQIAQNIFANPLMQAQSEPALATLATSSSPGMPPAFINDESGTGSIMPLPTPEVPSRLQQAGSLAAGGARLTGKALYHTARLGANAMDAIFFS